MATEPQPRVTLLGGFATEAGGAAVPDSAWRLRKAKELVKLLALADGHRLHREQAMDSLWPDRGPDSAGNNLNQAVHAARRALGAEAITLLDGVLRLEADVDVDAFERAAADARHEGTAQACRRALALYGGELLPENRYDDWASLERERLADLHSEVEQMLAELGGSRPVPRSLPVEASTFVGREHELGELTALLANTRLLTLTGAGGVGKPASRSSSPAAARPRTRTAPSSWSWTRSPTARSFPAPSRRRSTCGPCAGARRPSSTRCARSSSRSSSCSSSTTAST